MNVVALIKYIFLGILAAPLLGGIIWVILFIIACFGFEWLASLLEGSGWRGFFVISILCYPLVVWGAYQQNKEETTCPRCKTPFSWYEESIGSETLSESVVSEDVKVDDGNNRHHFERRAFRVGKRKYYYRATCKECGYTQDRTSVGSYKERV